MNENDPKLGRIQLYAAAIGGIVMLVASVLSMFDGEARRVGAESSLSTVYVTRLVRARDSPTTEGGAGVEEYSRGDALVGHWVTSTDGVTPWFRVAPNEAFVWGRNLSSLPLHGTDAMKRT